MCMLYVAFVGYKKCFECSLNPLRYSVCVRVRAYVCVRAYVYVRVCMYVCTCGYICMYVCVYVFACVCGVCMSM